MRNTAYNIFGKSWGIILNLAVIPFVVSYLGVERFGLWALLGIVTGYFGLLDLGFGSSFVKYISEYKSTSDDKGLNQVIRIGFVYYFLISLVICAVCIPWIPEIERLFKIPLSLSDEATFVLAACLAVLIVQNTLSIFTSVINGLQEMDLVNRIGVLIASLRVFGMVLCIILDYGLKGLMVNQILIATFNGLLMMRASYRRLPHLRLRPWTIDRAVFLKMFRFSMNIQVSRIAQMISFQMDRVLIGYFLNVASVAYYDIALRLSSAMRAFPLMITSAIVPAASELDTKKERDALKSLYFRGSKYLIFLSTPLVCFIILFASDIISVWMGSGFGKSAAVLQILAVGYYLNLVSGAASTIAMGMGRTDLEMKYGVLMAVLNLFFSIYLILKMGFYGAALGSAVSLGVGSLYYMHLFHGMLEQPIRKYFRLFTSPVAASAASSFVAAVFSRAVHVLHPGSGRVEMMLFLGCEFVLFVLVYLSLMLWTAYFERKEIVLVAQKIPLVGTAYERWMHGRQHGQVS